MKNLAKQYFFCKILNCYESSADNVMKDKYYYICDGKINDLVVAPVAGSAVLNPIMAC